MQNVLCHEEKLQFCVMSGTQSFLVSLGETHLCSVINSGIWCLQYLSVLDDAVINVLQCNVDS